MDRDGGFLPLENFDRARSLQELLGGVNRAILGRALTALLGAPFTICNTSGEVLVGDTLVEDPSPLVLEHDLEPIGTLHAAEPRPERRNAARDLVQLLVHSGARYHMASDLHLAAVRADYEALQAEHQKVVASEARYRDLAATLEQRVTEQVQTIESAQRQLYQAEKLASVGQLAAGVAHEINNPMGFIKSNLSTAAKYLEKLRDFATRIEPLVNGNDAYMLASKEADIAFLFADFKELLGESLSGAERVARIVKDLRAFSRIDSNAYEVVDLNEIVLSVCNVALPRIKERVTIVQQLHPLPQLSCHGGQLGQVFLNLVLNSADAMDHHGTLVIHTKSDGNNIALEFSDTGRGIPSDVLPRIFDPFFTTKGVGQGTGLGLTVCHDIVKAHGGKLSVKSQAGSGTTFTILLPTDVTIIERAGR